MKKFTIVFLLFALCLGACGELPPEATPTPAGSPAAESTSSPSSLPEATPDAGSEASPQPSPEIDPTPTPDAEPSPSPAATPAPESNPSDTPVSGSTPNPEATPTPPPSPEPTPELELELSPIVSPMPSPSLEIGLGPFTPPGGSGVTEPEGYAFTAQYVRTDGYHEGMDYPRVTVLRSRAELDTYYEANKGLYNLDGGFLNACSKYDDAYFQEQDLVLILLEEGSGSVRHEVTDVRQNSEGNWEISIRRKIPEAGTCDMAEWHIMVEIQMGKVIQEDKQVLIKNTF